MLEQERCVCGLCRDAANGVGGMSHVVGMPDGLPVPTLECGSRSGWVQRLNVVFKGLMG